MDKEIPINNLIQEFFSQVMENLEKGEIYNCHIATKNSYERRLIHLQANKKGWSHTTIIAKNEFQKKLTIDAKKLCEYQEQHMDDSPSYRSRELLRIYQDPSNFEHKPKTDLWISTLPFIFRILAIHLPKDISKIIGLLLDSKKIPKNYITKI